MKHPMVIRMIMRRYGLTRKQAVDKFGGNEKYLFKSIDGDRVRIDRMVDVMDALGYQLVFRPKGSGSLPEWSYPIRWSDYNNIKE